MNNLNLWRATLRAQNEGTDSGPARAAVVPWMGVVLAQRRSNGTCVLLTKRKINPTVPWAAYEQPVVRADQLHGAKVSWPDDTEPFTVWQALGEGVNAFDGESRWTTLQRCLKEEAGASGTLEGFKFFDKNMKEFDEQAFVREEILNSSGGIDIIESCAADLLQVNALQACQFFVGSVALVMAPDNFMLTDPDEDDSEIESRRWVRVLHLYDMLESPQHFFSLHVPPLRHYVNCFRYMDR